MQYFLPLLFASFTCLREGRRRVLLQSAQAVAQYPTPHAFGGAYTQVVVDPQVRQEGMRTVYTPGQRLRRTYR